MKRSYDETMSQRFSPELRERAVRMVGDGRMLLMSCKRSVDEIVYGRCMLGLRRLQEEKAAHIIDDIGQSDPRGGPRYTYGSDEQPRL